MCDSVQKAHTRTHADLNEIPLEAARREAMGSRGDLEKLLGSPVGAFAYPYRDPTEPVRAMVASVFPIAFGISEGLNSRDTDRHLLRRTMVGPKDSLLDMAIQVRLGHSPIQRARYRVALARGRVQRPSTSS